MKLAKVKATLEIEMVVPSKAISGMPTNEDETEQMRIVKELVLARMGGLQTPILHIHSVEDIE